MRTIQQNDIDPNIIRVLGVIRPTVEHIPSDAHEIGILATPGTVSSNSYVIELHKQNPNLHITQQACPMWVPLIESNEHESDGADYFVNKYISELLRRTQSIDTIILGCTHYPLLLPKIERILNGSHIRVISQGDIVAKALKDYLMRHNEIEKDIDKHHICQYLTTEAVDKFQDSASIFLSDTITATHITL